MTDPTFRAGFDAALETAINTALNYDPATRARLQKLDGKALELDLTAPQMTFCLGVEGERVCVHRHWEGRFPPACPAPPSPWCACCAIRRRRRPASVSASAVPVRCWRSCSR
ncbi:hypothetical protein [Microbulbifer taiwanensis]|uniref:hypothetical protein n=1 Tax=Microbulbifer taiwanensis TaxID=986746 RepID=UPI003609FF71